MSIFGFEPPDYGLIDDNPELFKQQYQAFVDDLGRRQAEAGDGAGVAERLHTALSAVQQQLQETQQLARQRQEALAAVTAQHDLAVAAYRQAMLNGDPSLPPELVQGQSVEEVDAALAKARGVVDYVRQKVMTGGGYSAAGPVTPFGTPPRVPAGAPGRTLPDVSAMTAREKLIFGTSYGR